MQKTDSEKAGFKRNNLDKSSSPYLLQHINNPIWWQEWSKDVLRYAAEVKKPIFVSVGYATCHWCHVMAAEAFSDTETARYLNKYFVCIKVDREQRPDIDQYMMDFINKQNGRGGWPLNVFLTPEIHPVFALTYAPAFERDSMFSFLSICEKLIEYYSKNIDAIPPFISEADKPSIAEETSLVESLMQYYDDENGGFGTGQKFPSHSTLLFLLYQLAIEDSPSLRTICTKTLDAMQQRGLHDHLQGGIFRYCVDREWTIPHFEKMLYDQAMALWNYSLAFSVIGKEEYKSMAEGIILCLNESFEENGLYISAHDADTGHEEGATYLWSYDELKELLHDDEFELFSSAYYITKHGNFESQNHLIRKGLISPGKIEDKLLSARKKRKQPSPDTKIICGLNALTAVALIQSGRLLKRPDLEPKAVSVINNILNEFWDGKTLGHSSYKGTIQKQPFLSDASALLFAITMLYESDRKWKILMDQFTEYVGSFMENEKWKESDADDFQKVYASCFDHPVPSAISLAEMGMTRSAILSGKEVLIKEYRQPFQSDFYNLSAMLTNGHFHVFTSREPLSWDQLPANSIQVRGEPESECYMGSCRQL